MLGDTVRLTYYFSISFNPFSFCLSKIQFKPKYVLVTEVYFQWRDFLGMSGILVFILAPK